MSRPRSERCKRGHLLAETRRTRTNGQSHDCRACLALTDAENRRNRVKPEPLTVSGGPEQLRLPFAPIEHLLVERGINISATFNGSSVKRWRTEGVPLLTADEIACRLGHHPGELFVDWPDWAVSA